MSINIIVYILLLLGFVLLSNKSTDKNRLFFILFCSLILVLKSALRSVSVGTDTSHYAGYFYESMSRSWQEIFYGLRYESGINDIESGYRFIEKFFSSFVSNFNLYTFLVQSILYYFPLGVMMYKENKSMRELLLSYVFLNALFSGLPMANARQVYALGFCVWTYMFIVDKKFFKALLCIGIGYTIHHTSLLFLLMFAAPFIPVKFYKKIIWLTFCFVPIILFKVNTIIVFMGSFIGSDKYVRYGENVVAGGALTYIVLSIGLSIFAAIALNKCQENDHKLKLYYAIVILSTFFTPLIYSNGSMMRITMYFQLFFVMLIHKLIVGYFPYYKKNILTLLTIILILLSVSDSISYKFFWEENQDPYLHWS